MSVATKRLSQANGIYLHVGDSWVHVLIAGFSIMGNLTTMRRRLWFAIVCALAQTVKVVSGGLGVNPLGSAHYD